MADETASTRKIQLTPFTIVSGFILIVGVILTVLRFTGGLAAVTNLSDNNPWGLWIGFDVITGVAFAGGAYVVTFMVYVLRAERYHTIVRATVRPRSRDRPENHVHPSQGIRSGAGRDDCQCDHDGGDQGKAFGVG